MIRSASNPCETVLGVFKNFKEYKNLSYITYTWIRFVVLYEKVVSDQNVYSVTENRL